MDTTCIVSPTGAHVHVLDNKQAWIDAVASALIETARESIAARNIFSLCLTGGSTPRSLYKALNREPFRSALDWSRVLIFFGDDRTVSPDHPDSNYRMAREAWLSQGPIPAEAIFRMEGEADGDPKALQAAADRYAALMRQHLLPDKAGFPMLDLLLLGMGSDGHTASLFPGTTALNEHMKTVCANKVPQHATWRLTLTLPVLNAARKVWFLVTGNDKAARAAQALGFAEGGHDLPVALVRPVEAPHWWLDRPAAGRIVTD